VTFTPLNLWSSFLEYLLRRARARHDRNPGERESVGLARAFLRASRPAEALAVAQRAKARFPGNDAVREIYQEARHRRATELLDETREALKSDQDVQLYVRASNLSRTLGNIEDAFAYIYEAKRLFPEHPAVHLSLGKLYFQRFNSTHERSDGLECLKHLERARELDPGDSKTALYLALTLAGTGSADQALEIIDSIPASHPDRARARKLKAFIERSLLEEARMPSVAPAEAGGARSGIPDAATAWRERLATAEGMLGYFLLDGEGEVVDSLTRPTDRFDFTDSLEGLSAMAAGCRHESGRIGMGSLISCTISGDAWQVCLRAIGPMSLVAFFDDRMASEDLEGLVDGMLVQDQLLSEGQACARS
jgi:tetratricopeptide (TPR) repeat protein